MECSRLFSVGGRGGRVTIEVLYCCERCPQFCFWSILSRKSACIIPPGVQPLYLTRAKVDLLYQVFLSRSSQKRWCSIYVQPVQSRYCLFLLTEQFYEYYCILSTFTASYSRSPAIGIPVTGCVVYHRACHSQNSLNICLRCQRGHHHHPSSWSVIFRVVFVKALWFVNYHRRSLFIFFYSRRTHTAHLIIGY